jgi:hypothetical protein
MRIALISHCAGKVAALEAGLHAMKQHAPDAVVVAGDLLSSPFSPDPPGQTIALLRTQDMKVIPGNTDRYLLDWKTPRWPHTLWMRLRRSDPVGGWLDKMAAGQALIPPADLAWLRTLPEELLLTDGVWICRGMPGNPWNSRRGGFECSGWVAPVFDNEAMAFLNQVYQRADAFLFGRRTYEIFARSWARGQIRVTARSGRQAGALGTNRSPLATRGFGAGWRTPSP